VAKIRNFWALLDAQSAMSSWTPLELLPPGTSRQRPLATFLRVKAPV
jgi:hypothetical protein